MTAFNRIGDVGTTSILSSRVDNLFQELLQIDSILKEDVENFADCKLMILYLSF